MANRREIARKGPFAVLKVKNGYIPWKPDRMTGCPLSLADLRILGDLFTKAYHREAGKEGRKNV